MTSFLGTMGREIYFILNPIELLVYESWENKRLKFILESKNLNIFVSASESRGNLDTNHVAKGSDSTSNWWLLKNHFRDVSDKVSHSRLRKPISCFRNTSRYACHESGRRAFLSTFLYLALFSQNWNRIVN